MLTKSSSAQSGSRFERCSRGLGKSIVLQPEAKRHDIILTYNSKQAEAESVVAEIQKQGRQAATLPLNVSESKSRILTL